MTTTNANNASNENDNEETTDAVNVNITDEDDCEEHFCFEKRTIKVQLSEIKLKECVGDEKCHK